MVHFLEVLLPPEVTTTDPCQNLCFLQTKLAQPWAPALLVLGHAGHPWGFLQTLLSSLLAAPSVGLCLGTSPGLQS